MGEMDASANDKPQRGIIESVNRIRVSRDIWEQQGTRLGRIDVLLKAISLLASAAIAAFGASFGQEVLKVLALIAFAGTGLAGAFRLAKKSDTYWRAWRIVNWALISYDAGELEFAKLAKEHRTAEHLFEGWADDERSPTTPPSPARP